MSNNIGMAAENFFKGEMQVRGHTVLPVDGDHDGYDIVIHNGKEYIKVQVKGAHLTSNNSRRHQAYNFYFNGSRAGSGRIRSDRKMDIGKLSAFKMAACYCFDTRTWYHIPSINLKEKIGGYGHISISKTYSKKWIKYKEAWYYYSPDYNGEIQRKL